MIKSVKRRLAIMSMALVGLSGALYLIFDGLRDNLIFFYSPTELLEKHIQPQKKIRVGGMVKAGSLVWGDNQKISFILTDFKTELRVDFEGIPPDLFRVGQGAVAEGFLSSAQAFNALTILAKHDENYMPPQILQKEP
jgi:cytochrome c-type biogenesis protein CcmE